MALDRVERLSADGGGHCGIMVEDEDAAVRRLTACCLPLTPWPRALPLFLRLARDRKAERWCDGTG